MNVSTSASVLRSACAEPFQNSKTMFWTSLNVVWLACSRHEMSKNSATAPADLDCDGRGQYVCKCGSGKARVHEEDVRVVPRRCAGIVLYANTKGDGVRGEA